mmetsp:Transcript_22697/g.33301  ORF Transcript_22697/g.33301 Transcript_22697/m.33301 type:complete len:202 (+) Transcript_22697:1390-1995(+)
MTYLQPLGMAFKGQAGTHLSRTSAMILQKKVSYESICWRSHSQMNMSRANSISPVIRSSRSTEFLSPTLPYKAWFMAACSVDVERCAASALRVASSGARLNSRSLVRIILTLGLMLEIIFFWIQWRISSAGAEPPPATLSTASSALSICTSLKSFKHRFISRTSSARSLALPTAAAGGCSGGVTAVLQADLRRKSVMAGSE